MELSEREQKLVAKMRRHEQQWHWVRWWVLFIGIFSSAAAVFWFWAAVSRVGSDDTASVALNLSLAFPNLLLGVGFATWSFISASSDWHGNATRSLLLRLIDAATDEENRKDHTA